MVVIQCPSVMSGWVWSCFLWNRWCIDTVTELVPAVFIHCWQFPWSLPPPPPIPLASVMCDDAESVIVSQQIVCLVALLITKVSWNKSTLFLPLLRQECSDILDCKMFVALGIYSFFRLDLRSWLFEEIYSWLRGLCIICAIKSRRQ